MSQANYRSHSPQQSGRQPMPGRRPEPGRQNAAPRGYAYARGAQNARRPAQPSRGYMPRSIGSSGMPYGLGRLLLIGVAACALALALQFAWPDGFPLAHSEQTASNATSVITEIHSAGPLRINEIMTGNRNTLSIAEGTSPDWVEVINIGTKAVSLEGWKLAESANSATVFTFPAIQLAPQECVLVYCDSKLRENADEELHAPFRLSSAGDTLMLFNTADAAVDTLNIPALSYDHSYARMDTARWEICDMPTPGMANTQENYLLLKEPASDSPVIINEIVSSNRTALEDENGQYYDYIELYNRSSERVELGGWYLSDDAENLRKWRFPEVSIEPGAYLVVYASKLDRSDDPAHLHASFALSSEGESVVLTSNAGRMMDRVDFGLLKADTAYARQADGTWQSAAPTPGKAN